MLHDIYASQEESSRYSLSSFIKKSTFIEVAEEISIQNKTHRKEFVMTLDDGLTEHYWAAKTLNDLGIKTYVFAPFNPIFRDHIIHSHLIQYLVTSKYKLEIFFYIEKFLLQANITESEITKYKQNNYPNSSWTNEMVFITKVLRYSIYGKQLTNDLFNEFISKKEKLNSKNLYMKPKDLEEISKLENILIGGHGGNSDILTETKSLNEEINLSYKMLEELCIKNKYFAYPNGIYNENIIKALKVKGFNKAFSTEFKNNNVKNNEEYKINRIDLATLLRSSSNTIKDIFNNF